MTADMDRTCCILLMYPVIAFIVSGGELHHNFFSAAKSADSFLVVKTNDSGQIIARYMLPNNAIVPDGWKNNGMPCHREEGAYIFPVRNREVMNCRHPGIKADNPEGIYSMLLQFKGMETEDENFFLMGNALAGSSSMRLAALRRIQENGFFNCAFDRNTTYFFRNLYMETDLSVIEKRLLLENFAVCNFDRMQEVYVLALSDKSVARLAGMVFHEKNRELLASIVRKSISDEELWRQALWQSDHFVNDKEFVANAMGHFDKSNPFLNSADFIPLLFSTAWGDDTNREIIRRFLKDSRDTARFELYRVLSYWLNREGAECYQKEIIQFLANNKNNPCIAESIIFPTMLSALNKTGNQQAGRLMLRYFEDLKARNNDSLTKQVLLLFKNDNRPIPTLDELIDGLR